MKIIKILNEGQLKHVRSLAENIDFQSGDKTARGLAKEAKNNSEAIPEGESYKELLSYIIKVASGEVEINARRLGQNDFIPWKRGLSL